MTATSYKMTGALNQEDVLVQMESLAVMQGLLSKLKAAKAEGRVVIRLKPLDALEGSEYDLELEREIS